MSNPRKAPRIAAALAVAVGMLMAFAALGGVGLAQTGVSAGQYQYGKKKVTICHKGKKTIRVSKAAFKAHKRHGDTLGRCDRAGKKGSKHKGHKGQKAHKSEKSHQRGEKAGHKGSEKAKEHSAKEKGSKGEHPGKGKRGGKG